MKSEAKRLPTEFLERLERIVSPRHFHDVANTFVTAKPTTFRVNPLKASRAEVQQNLESAGFRLQNISWHHEAFVLKNYSLRELQSTEEYQKGKIYVQNLSSMIPPLVLNPQPGENVLDLAAAPGSKTTQMAAMMKGQGRLVANDNNRVRFFKLKANVEAQGALNVECHLRYGETFGRRFPDFFDKVLLDAPCSAEGRFDIHDPASYRYWRGAKIEEMMRKQKKLFHSAFGALAPGGTLVYSTCTFAPEENEGILSWALEKFKGSMTIVDFELPIQNCRCGLAQWGKYHFDASVKKSKRILPTSEMEGFFIAKVGKKD